MILEGRVHFDHFPTGRRKELGDRLDRLDGSERLASGDLASRLGQLDKDDVPIQFLGERVRQALLAREDKSVFIRADGQVTVQEMAAVWDKLKEGGVEKVGMMTKPVER